MARFGLSMVSAVLKDVLRSVLTMIGARSVIGHGAPQKLVLCAYNYILHQTVNC